MRDYDTMTAMEILQELLMFEQTGSIWGTPESPFRLTSAVEHEKDLVAALRKAVIREASVGVVAVPRYGDGEITIDIDEADYVPSADDSIEGHHRAIIESIKKKVPEGKYDLIPREVEP